MIYVPQLWQEELGEDDDKLSKMGGTMIGPLDMGNNKIIGLSNEYPPADDEACRWDQVKEYAKGPIHITHEHSERGVSIDHTGINAAHGSNIRVNIPASGGPEIEMKQLYHNTLSSLSGGIRIISNDNQKHYQLGWSTDDVLTLYATDSGNPPSKEVCKFTQTGITGIINPVHDTDAANKRYVDMKKNLLYLYGLHHVIFY